MLIRHVNSTLNPLFYIILNPTFKNSFKQIFWVKYFSNTKVNSIENSIEQRLPRNQKYKSFDLFYIQPLSFVCDSPKCSRRLLDVLHSEIQSGSFILFIDYLFTLNFTKNFDNLKFLKKLESFAEKTSILK